MDLNYPSKRSSATNDKIAFNIFISTIFVNLIIMELDFLRESASNQSSACICGTLSPKCKCLKNTCASSGTNEI